MGNINGSQLTGHTTSSFSAASTHVSVHSKVNGNHSSVSSSINTNRHNNLPYRNNTITNGIHNGTKSANISSMINGLGSPGKRKSRDSRDNSPVPPAFSRQNIKIEPSLADATLSRISKEELRSINLRNQNVRQVIYKEVKRPGKNHDRLIQMLKQDLHGPSQIRREYIKEVIAEAGRFKRKALVDLLEQRMEEIIIDAATL